MTLLQNFFQNCSMQSGDDFNDLESYEQFEQLHTTTTAFLIAFFRSNVLRADRKSCNTTSHTVFLVILIHQLAAFLPRKLFKIMLLRSKRLLLFKSWSEINELYEKIENFEKNYWKLWSRLNAHLIIFKVRKKMQRSALKNSGSVCKVV